ncbi:unnamed protein product [Miscanthus lutarioriparius]|uniref:Vacuolar iron transporter n=1 Tax=Miscanthus lutarioriparius TaxID=422564 RepID=A0A811QDB2_9POAL|nr:unnamed protein product [Miscanthus lutarioriparius]
MATAVSNDDASKLTVVVLGPGAVGAAAAAASAVSAATKPSARHVQWLRAAVLGASDGLVSTAALMLGVGAARPGDADADDLSGSGGVLLAGLAGLVAGACSMAIGEYVSVHAQLDVELADLRRAADEEEAAAGDGDDGAPVDRTAGLSSPGQAAAASAVSFAAGAAVPLLAAVVVATAAATLAVFGWLGAVLGRAPGGRAGLRAVVGGLVAMGITYGLMKLFRIHGV